VALIGEPGFLRDQASGWLVHRGKVFARSIRRCMT